jgi:hypothetical protein
MILGDPLLLEKKSFFYLPTINNTFIFGLTQIFFEDSQSIMHARLANKGMVMELTKPATLSQCSQSAHPSP